MKVSRLPREQRELLLDMIAEADPDPEEWLERLRRAGGEGGFEACSAVVRLLANLVRDEEGSDRLLQRILEHRVELASALARDPGIQVACVDYLTNIKALLTNPKVVELSQFERTMRSATTDPLTGLFNRGHFDRVAKSEIARCRRHHQTFSVVMLDLDRFKDVNDGFGHLVGDIALRRLANCMRKTVRDVDLACRYGGEEFALLLPETERLGAYVAAERLRSRVQLEFENRPTGKTDLRLTISGGIAVYPEDGTDLPSLVKRADEGLYAAKRNGRNRIALFYREQRAHIRYPVRGHTDIRMTRAEREQWIRVRGVDISASGLLVEAARPVECSTVVRFRLADRADPAAGPWELEGTVVRSEPAGTKGRRLGIALARPVPESCLRKHVRGPERAAG